MNIVDLISLERIAVDADVASKKRSLETLSELLTRESDTLSANTVFDKLISRERLGSTGLGRGVALPHARIEGSREALGAFVKLQSGVDFDAFDKQPVDLMFALVVPEHFTDEHLQILSSLAELFSDQELCERLRTAETPQQIHQMLLDWQAARESA